MLALGLSLAVGAASTENSPEPDDAQLPRVLLVAADEARFASPVTGRVLRVTVRPGDRFEKGTVLVEFDCARQDLDLGKARSRLEMADATYQSNRRLQELQSIGELELSLSRAQRDEADAEVRRAALEVQYCRLVAPWDGGVVARRVNPLESVSIGQPLLEVISSATPLLQLYVPSGWLASLSLGARFEVEILETGQRYPAVITRLGTQVDAVSRTVELFGEFGGKPEGLLPGMTGSALLGPSAQ